MPPWLHAIPPAIALGLCWWWRRQTEARFAVLRRELEFRTEQARFEGLPKQLTRVWRR